MSEENKTVELNDEELGKVNGGGSGVIPQGGIVFSTYYWIDDGYYSSGQNTSDVVYVYTNVGGDLYYTRESFVCDGNTWQSTKVFGPVEIENEAKFRSNYPYFMNVGL